ncbi:hypothetical protein MMC29_001929 [Sticta canariensis]|nr:hypothetical protein [Sticta canariensis]
MNPSGGSLAFSEAILPEPTTDIDMDLSQDESITEASPEISRAVDLLRGSTTIAAPSGVILAALRLSQGLSTTYESEVTAQTLGSQVEDRTDGDRLRREVYPVAAASIVFGLSLFGCKLRSIYNFLYSYGFKYSLRAVMLLVPRHQIKYSDDAHPHDGRYSFTGMVESGSQSSMTVDYVNGKPIAFIHTYKPLPALAPLYGQTVSTVDGRRIIVQLTAGQLQIRASRP